MNSEGYSAEGFPAMDSPAAFTSEGGPFFTGSHDFTINNSVFNNITTVEAPVVPPDIREIPLGDIDLQTQLRADELSFEAETGLVRRRSCSRRVYSAKVGRQGENMTVVVYEGDAAEQGWHSDAAKYLNIRHPNVLQIYGVAASRGIHASLFHGDLVPYQEFLIRHGKSYIVTIYIEYYVSMQFETFRAYFKSRFTSGRGLVGSLYSSGSHDVDNLNRFVQYLSKDLFWIRALTGQLSTEIRLLDPGSGDIRFAVDTSGIKSPTFLFNAPSLEGMVVDCMTLEHFHEACGWQYKSLQRDIPPVTTINLGTVVSLTCSSEHPDKDYVETASMKEARATGEYGWCSNRGYEDIMPNGWTRFFVSSDRNKTGVHLPFSFSTLTPYEAVWLTQANCIFKTGQITSFLDEYALLDSVTFYIDFEHTTHDPPDGYLFLCPETHFLTGPVSFRWPDYPAYWSQDPSGLEPLSADDADTLGFPTLSPRTRVTGRCWDASVYAGLRQFHAAKGFNPDSQDVARHLGYPLYEPVCKVDPTSAHIDSLPEDSVNEPEVENVSVLESQAPLEDTETANTPSTLISCLIRGVSAILEPREENVFGSLV
ncbi:hypothetical protein C8R46DRAFT_49346 [Mycena filopes]|nr:hypothetical protein C8R46DRAFT_49346 [Mycena filopes]